MSLYEDLDLKYSPDLSQEDIKRAFRIAALKHHPDRLQSNECEGFKRILHAYETLRHDESKRKYDGSRAEPAKFKFTLDTFKNMMQEWMDDDEPFTKMMDDVAIWLDKSTAVSSTSIKDKTIVYDSVVATLDEVYHQVTKYLHMDEHVICPKCQGRDEACVTCLGKQLVKVTHDIPFTLTSALQYTIQTANGWVVHIQLRLQPHPTFQYYQSITHSAQNDCDLFMIMTIPLASSINRLIQPWTHLDGKTYCATYQDLIVPGQILYANDLGLLKKSGGRGRLYIQFKIHYPADRAQLVVELKQKSIVAFNAIVLHKL